MRRFERRINNIVSRIFSKKSSEYAIYRILKISLKQFSETKTKKSQLYMLKLYKQITRIVSRINLKDLYES